MKTGVTVEAAMETRSAMEPRPAKPTFRERGRAGGKEEPHAERREKNKTMPHFNLPPADRQPAHETPWHSNMANPGR